MVPALAMAVDEARRKIKELFRERASERAKIVVEDWKAQKLYPYEGEAATQIERAERQIFDIIAVTVQEATQTLVTYPARRWLSICACCATRSSAVRPSCSGFSTRCCACRNASKRNSPFSSTRPIFPPSSAPRP